MQFRYHIFQRYYLINSRCPPLPLPLAPPCNDDIRGNTQTTSNKQTTCEDHTSSVRETHPPPYLSIHKQPHQTPSGSKEGANSAERAQGEPYSQNTVGTPSSSKNWKIDLQLCTKLNSLFLILQKAKYS